MDNKRILIGKFILHKREESGMTQDEIASRSGVSRATLWKIERDEDGLNMSIDTLLKLLDALSTNLEELATYVMSPNNLNSKINSLPTNEENKKIIESLLGNTIK